MRVVALWQPGMVDVKAWKAWGLLAAERGPQDVYGPPDRELLDTLRSTGRVPRTQFLFRGEAFEVDYPPGSLVLLCGVGRAYRALDPGETNGRLYTVLLGLLGLVGSLGILAFYLRSADGDLARRRALGFWCNPALLLAALLGYQDPVFALASLGAIDALAGARFVAAAAFVVTAGLLKPQASLLLPAFVALALFECPWRRWAAMTLAGVGVAAIGLSPWWLHGHLLSAIEGSLRPLLERTASAQCLNLWWLVGYVAQWSHDRVWPLARILTLDEFVAMTGWSPAWPARVLLVGGTLMNAWMLLRRPAADTVRVPLAVVLQVHLYALCATSVHENHTFLAVAAAPLLVGAWEKGRAVLALTSAFLFANLFLFEGLGRGVLRDRWLWHLRLAAGVDLTAAVAAAHVALVVLLFVWTARRPRAPGALA